LALLEAISSLKLLVKWFQQGSKCAAVVPVFIRDINRCLLDSLLFFPKNQNASKKRMFIGLLHHYFFVQL
jgi:hypothetical protein